MLTIYVLDHASGVRAAMLYFWDKSVHEECRAFNPPPTTQSWCHTTFLLGLKLLCLNVFEKVIIMQQKARNNVNRQVIILTQLFEGI